MPLSTAADSSSANIAALFNLSTNMKPIPHEHDGPPNKTFPQIHKSKYFLPT